MLTSKGNKFAITIDSVLEKALKDVKNEVLIDEYPVEFDESVDFMFSGQVVKGFGELQGYCSYGLLSLMKDRIEIKDFIGMCVKRFLAGDMGEGNEETVRATAMKFHEGLSVGAEYVTDLISEGRIILTTEEFCDEEMPRCIWATLPSEEKLICDWYDRHSEECSK